MNFCPLGACALAGTGLPIDRFLTSDALGFTAPMRNRYIYFDIYLYIKLICCSSYLYFINPAVSSLNCLPFDFM